jgi:hypothetical protein
LRFLGRFASTSFAGFLGFLRGFFFFGEGKGSQQARSKRRRRRRRRREEGRTQV